MPQLHFQHVSIVKPETEVISTSARHTLQTNLFSHTKKAPFHTIWNGADELKSSLLQQTTSTSVLVVVLPVLGLDGAHGVDMAVKEQEVSHAGMMVAHHGVAFVEGARKTGG